jgi:hypothetical protein
MSDQQETGVITSLEEVFLSREFGRAPSRPMSFRSGTQEVAPPPQLEQLFLADEFGQPERVAAATAATLAPPALVALPGRAATERDRTRYRAIAAVSGVAAAALVVVGITSGTGQPARQPTVSAQGPGSSSSPSGPTGGTPPGTTTPPGSSGAGAGAPLAATAGSGSGATVASLVSATSPSGPQVIVEVPPGTTVEVAPVSPAPPPPAGSGGTPPSPPSGGSSILTPVLVVVGNTVSAVGTTVTAASDGLGNALPFASPLTGLVGNLGDTVTSLGRSVAGTAT